MKHRTLLVVVLVFATQLVAADGAPPPAPADFAALEQFLGLDDAQLAQMQQAIARVRAMSPAQRAQLKTQIAQFRQLPASEREALRQGWGQESPEIREGWRTMMQSLDEPARAAIRQRLETATPEERIKLRREMVQKFLREGGARP